MRVSITDDCISCGRCVEICPEVFDMGDDIAIVKVQEVPSEHEEAVRQSADECPTAAIVIES